MEERTFKSEEKAQMSGLNPTGKKRNSEETGGNNRKEREIPGRFRKAAERTGKNGKIFGSGPKGRGLEFRQFNSGEYCFTMLSGFLHLGKCYVILSIYNFLRCIWLQQSGTGAISCLPMRDPAGGSTICRATTTTYRKSVEQKSGIRYNSGSLGERKRRKCRLK